MCRVERVGGPSACRPEEKVAEGHRHDHPRDVDEHTRTYRRISAQRPARPSGARAPARRYPDACKDTPRLIRRTPRASARAPGARERGAAWSCEVGQLIQWRVDRVWVVHCAEYARQTPRPNTATSFLVATAASVYTPSRKTPPSTHTPHATSHGRRRYAAILHCEAPKGGAAQDDER